MSQKFKKGDRVTWILRAKKGDLTEDDAAHMRKVVGYVHRHLARSPPEPSATRPGDTR